MDPNAPRPPVNNKSLTHVQQWVMSVLAATTILHLSAGLVVTALFLPEGNLAAQVGLCLIAGAFGVLAVAAGFAIHRRNPVSAWLLLGTLPAVVGLWLVLV